MLWFAGSLPALTLVLSFIAILLRFGLLKLAGHDLTLRDRYMPPRGLTNDRVVVRVGSASLDASLQFHRILLSSQPPLLTLSPGVAIIPDQNLVPGAAAASLGGRPQSCN